MIIHIVVGELDGLKEGEDSWVSSSGRSISSSKAVSLESYPDYYLLVIKFLNKCKLDDRKTINQWECIN